MSDYLYEFPNEEKFYIGIKAVVKSQYSHDQELCELVNASRCDFYGTTTYSQKRWNAFYAEVRFFVPMEIFAKYNSVKMELIESTLLDICKQLMPPEIGYDIMKVTVSPDMSSNTGKDSLEEIKEVVENRTFLRFNGDLIEKGKKMADAYISLYVLENYIRQYIDAKMTEKYGNNYMDSIAISRRVKSGIESRRNEEQSKKWLPLRGDKDLFYMDFTDLADVIVNNWDCFENDSPDQRWIKVKIQEMYDIRCLIAHNSYISEDNIQLLNLTTKQILSQLQF